MKFLYQVFAIFTIAIVAVSAHAQNKEQEDSGSNMSTLKQNGGANAGNEQQTGDGNSSVDLENAGSNTTVKVTIKPIATAVGKLVNVWISAVYQGVPYFYSGAAWVRYTGGPYPVAMKGRVLSPSTQLTIAKESDMTFFPGADLYVGYGTSEEDLKSSPGKLTKVYKMVKKFKWAARPVL